MNQVCHAPPLTVEAKCHTIFCCLSGLAKDRSDLWLIKSACDIKSADFMVLQNCNNNVTLLEHSLGAIFVCAKIAPIL